MLAYRPVCVGYKTYLGPNVCPELLDALPYAPLASVDEQLAAVIAEDINLKPFNELAGGFDGDLGVLVLLCAAVEAGYQKPDPH